MRMLEAGGLSPLVDDRRPADEFNPRGYYEFEAVKSLRGGDPTWLHQARGRVVKIVSPLLPFLPADHRYAVIMMRRDLSEVMRSQAQMLRGFNKTSDPEEDRRLRQAFEDHLRRIQDWLDAQPNIRVFPLNYNLLLSDPAALVVDLVRFLGRSLDRQAMAAAVDPGLYRNRSQAGPAL